MTAMTWSANQQTNDSVEMINECAAPTQKREHAYNTKPTWRMK